MPFPSTLRIGGQFAACPKHGAFEDGINKILVLVVNELEAISKVNVVVY